MGYAKITGPGPNPSGLCECGCGRKTRLAPHGDRKLGWVAGKPIRFIRGHSSNPERSNEPRYTHNGYLMISMPDHPRADSHGYVREHIVPENLVICQDRGYHMLLHKRQRAKEETGHPGWIRCEGCNRYRDPEIMYVRPVRLAGICRPCVRRQSRERRAAEQEAA